MSGHKINDLLILQLQMCESNDGCLEKKCLNQKSNQIINFEKRVPRTANNSVLFFLSNLSCQKQTKERE